jgi:hypothetical protein
MSGHNSLPMNYDRNRKLYNWILESVYSNLKAANILSTTIPPCQACSKLLKYASNKNYDQVSLNELLSPF